MDIRTSRRPRRKHAASTPFLVKKPFGPHHIGSAGHQSTTSTYPPVWCVSAIQVHSRLRSKKRPPRPALGDIKHPEAAAVPRVDDHARRALHPRCAEGPQTPTRRHLNPNGLKPWGVIDDPKHRWAPWPQGAAGFVTLIFARPRLRWQRPGVPFMTSCQVVQRARQPRGRFSVRRISPSPWRSSRWAELRAANCSPRKSSLTRAP